MDNCSGHSHHTIDGFKYHYHIAGPVGDLETSPLYPTPDSERWPYTFGCFRGIPSDWSQTSVGTPYPDLECTESGVTDDYVPKPVDGITEVFYYPAQDDDDASSFITDNGAGELFRFYALLVTFIFGMMMI